MGDHEMVRVRVLRDYPRGGHTWLPGDVISVPAYALPNILKARPPFGVVVGTEVPVGSAPVELDATEGAIALAEKLGLDLAQFAGQGSGPGRRIYRDDVKRWGGAE